jgi:uncharacterized protein YyaL (SSP411 family)
MFRRHGTAQRRWWSKYPLKVQSDNRTNIPPLTGYFAGNVGIGVSAMFDLIEPIPIRQSEIHLKQQENQMRRIFGIVKPLCIQCSIATTLLLAGCSNGLQSIANTTQTSQYPVSQYWTYAEDTHEFVVGNLLTSYGGYEITLGSSTSYTWYNASQIDADAAMDVEGDGSFASYMNNTYSWMNNVWDFGSPSGGYYASVNVNGSSAGGGQYVDDNSLTGIAYLDAYETTTGSQQAAYLTSAEAIANWLMNSGQWDSTCGGGFWWSNAKTIKPTQSNGLALQFFLRLYKITGRSYYSQWATSIKTWLESTMYGGNGLYIWELNNSCTANATNFTYDNSIMIEADLLWASVMSDSSYVGKAESIANALNSVLWDSTHQVYEVQTGSSLVTPVYSAWASEALVRLYQADTDTTWLNYAEENINFMNAYLRNTADYGYYSSCNNDGSNRSSTMQEVDQAWMERTQALLALYR